MATLEIKDLHVEVEDKDKKSKKKILKGVNLSLKTGEIHAIMGPNGTGKSTLSETIMGNPRYHVTQGDILLNKSCLTNNMESVSMIFIMCPPMMFYDMIVL